MGFTQHQPRDGLNRLNNDQRGLLNSGNTAIDTLDFEQDWSLDQVANWTGFDEDDDGDGTDELVQTRDHNKVNEITDITNNTGVSWIEPAYDDAGNTTTLPKPDDPGATSAFTAKYDAWNRLVALTQTPGGGGGGGGGTKLADYTYDARNFRIRKETYDGTGTLEHTYDYYYTAGWQCVEEVHVPQTGTGSLTQYFWGLRYIDDLICREKTPDGGSTTRHYALGDRRFNVVAIVPSAGGAVDERYSYTPYGTVTFLSASWAVQSASSHDWVYLFQGLRRDQESGLIENRNRVLNPLLGCFMQRDPLGYPDGMNAYAEYHAIISRTDPFGLGFWNKAKAVAAAVVVEAAPFLPALIIGPMPLPIDNNRRFPGNLEFANRQKIAQNWLKLNITKDSFDLCNCECAAIKEAIAAIYVESMRERGFFGRAADNAAIMDYLETGASNNSFGPGQIKPTEFVDPLLSENRLDKLIGDIEPDTEEYRQRIVDLLMKEPEAIACTGLQKILDQWDQARAEDADIADLRDNPGTLATLYNLGYRASNPNATPRTGGGEWPAVDPIDRSFGENAKRFMESDFAKELFTLVGCGDNG